MFEVKVSFVVENSSDLIDKLEWIIDHAPKEWHEYISEPPYSSTIYKPGDKTPVGKLQIKPV